MCEFCVSHGEGKKWYENLKNYTHELFKSVNSEERLREYLMDFHRSLSVEPARAHKWKRRFPRIYDWLIYPRASKHLKETHFGQVVPLEDVERILDNFTHLVRLPCVCRRVTTGDVKRICYGIGHDFSQIYGEVPEFKEFEHVPVDEVKEHIRSLDNEGMIHSVWTFMTPYIGALCNCDRDCMAYKVEKITQVAKVMWKGEYVANCDPLQCTGCRKCMKVCYFGAMKYDGVNEKVNIQPEKCYGCGICRAACEHGAIRLEDRMSVPQAAELW
jgi:ferredoxin